MSRTTAPAATVLHPCSARSRSAAGPACGGFCVQSLERRLMLAAVELDQGFGTPDGIRALEVPGEVFHGAHDLVVLPGGKMVTAGRDGGGRILAVRYNADGTPDRSFGGGDGIASSWVVGRAEAVAVAPDGDLIVAGTVPELDDPFTDDFALVRFNADGTLDNGFGHRGRVRRDFGGDDRAEAVTLLPDGKILAAGSARNGLLLARFGPDGRPDKSFGNGGRRITPFGEGGGSATDFAVLPDGKILTAGSPTLARFTREGRIDRTFGGGDSATSGGVFARAMAVLAGGDVVVAGTVETVCYSDDFGGSNCDDDLAVARFRPDGTPVSSFGDGGTAVVDIGDVDDDVTDVVALPDGGFVVSGKRAGSGFDYDPEDQMALVRFRGNGAPEPSFGDRGILLPDWATRESADAIALSPAGKLSRYE